MAAAVLPASRVPDSKDAPSLRWGIMGPGWIAERFTESVQAHSRQVIAAVGSRSLSRSKEFAEKFGVPAAYGSYEELASAPDVDIVYVTTPHNFHHSAALLALEAGKHVLVEKPIGLNAEQARDIAARARSAGVFATEAMWTFFLPKFDIIRQILVTDQHKFVRDSGATLLRELVGDGLLTSDEPRHRERRRVMQPAFHREQVASYAKSMADESERLAKTWVPASRVDIGSEMKRLTLSIVGSALFGIDFGASTTRIADVLQKAIRRSAYISLALPLLEPFLAAYRRFLQNRRAEPGRTNGLRKR